MSQPSQAYEKLARHLYGNACEWKGCGWHDATCDVHHLDYQEQQQFEKEIRDALDQGNQELADGYMKAAKAMGYGDYDKKTRQLEKNSVGTNLSVLCPNHHRYLHHKDLGMKALQYLPGRHL